MQIRGLAIHDGFGSEKKNFILDPLSGREPIKICKENHRRKGLITGKHSRVNPMRRISIGSI